VRFDTAGRPDAPKKGLLLHAMAVDNMQFQELCRYLQEDYELILPVFDGHYREDKTVFTTIEDQANQILAYLAQRGIAELDFVAGVSLGACVAFELYKRGQLKVRKYLLDGGPFFLFGPVRKALFRCLFRWPLSILKAHPRLAWILRRKFGGALTDRIVYLASFLTKRDVNQMVRTLFEASIPEPLNDGNSRLVFLYGSREDAYRSFARFRNSAGYELIVKDRYGHCQYLAKQSKAYAALLRS
jgi:pimeloyl-ACP methyl ester carboxylesterase